MVSIPTTLPRHTQLISEYITVLERVGSHISKDGRIKFR